MKKSNAVKCTVSHMKMLMYWANGVANWPIPWFVVVVVVVVLVIVVRFIRSATW